MNTKKEVRERLIDLRFYIQPEENPDMYKHRIFFESLREANELGLDGKKVLELQTGPTFNLGDSCVQRLFMNWEYDLSGFSSAREILDSKKRESKVAESRYCVSMAALLLMNTMNSIIIVIAPQSRLYCGIVALSWIVFSGLVWHQTNRLRAGWEREAGYQKLLDRAYLQLSRWSNK